tara:strand:- start:497 stop:838 length:342 start_codon:yes stop_codon:yes gene_type:complete
MTKPLLIEPGTKYFLSATLKKCNIKKRKNDRFYFNVILLSIFIIVILSFLIYKYKNKPTTDQIQQKNREKEIYILSKVRNVIERKEKEQTDMLTNLPKFESDYKMLHEKYYKL